MDPGKDFGKCRFSSAIFTQQRVDFASVNINIHIAQYFNATELFGHGARLYELWNRSAQLIAPRFRGVFPTVDIDLARDADLKR